MRKGVSLLLFIFGLSVVSSYGQTEAKLEEKAKANVTKLNEQLTAINATLAMNEDQKTKVYDAYLAGEKEMKVAREAAKTEEEKKESQKPIRQAMNANVRKNILTKEQRNALNAKKE